MSRGSGSTDSIAFFLLHRQRRPSKGARTRALMETARECLSPVHLGKAGPAVLARVPPPACVAEGRRRRYFCSAKHSPFNEFRVGSSSFRAIASSWRMTQRVVSAHTTGSKSKHSSDRHWERRSQGHERMLIHPPSGHHASKL